MGDLTASGPTEVLIAVCQDLYIRFEAILSETGLDANGLIGKLLDLYDRVTKIGSRKAGRSQKASTRDLLQEADKRRRAKRQLKTKRRAPRTSKTAGRPAEWREGEPETVTEQLYELSIQGNPGDCEPGASPPDPANVSVPVHADLPARRSSRKPSTPKRKLVESDNSLDTPWDGHVVTRAPPTPKRRRKNKPQKLVPLAAGEDNSASDQENGPEEKAEAERNRAPRKSKLVARSVMNGMDKDTLDAELPSLEENDTTGTTESAGDVQGDWDGFVVKEGRGNGDHCPVDGDDNRLGEPPETADVQPVKVKRRKARRKSPQIKPKKKVLQTGENVYKCKFCNSTFHFPGHLKRHVEGLHGKSSTFPCRGCGKSSSSQLARTYHEALACKLVQFPHSCGSCQMRFESESEVRDHKCSMDPSKPCACATCDYKTSSPRDLIEHMRVHTGEKCFKCDQCDFATAWRKNLKEHLFKHTGLKPYVCELCGFATNDRHNIRSHRTTHSAQKDFMCEVCGEKFREARFLKAHQIVHTNAKPYKCSLCNYSARFKSNVRSHMVCHTNVKKFACGLCGQSFRTKNHLKIHQTAVHMFPSMMYGCKHCDYTAPNSQSINSHMRKHTKKPKKPKPAKEKAASPVEPSGGELQLPVPVSVPVPESPERDNQKPRKEMNIYRFEAAHQDGGQRSASPGGLDGLQGDVRQVETTFTSLSAQELPDLPDSHTDPGVFSHLSGVAPGDVLTVIPCFGNDPPGVSDVSPHQDQSGVPPSADITRPQYEELFYNPNASQAETISAMMTLIREIRPR